MIIATAGHVDHGKTQLVKAITGVDTDSLAEEKKRGLSIDIGFAYLPIDGHPSISFIDVPGHDRFIKNALCGLSAADFVLLLVAADDGPMPQTEEHISIIDLLDIRHGAIVISKTDRVSAGRFETVSKLINRVTKNTTLEGWPKFPVSCLNNQGVEELYSYLVKQAVVTDETNQSDGDHSNFRMAIDRSFEKKGVGLIVTGTIFSGTIAIDDQVVFAGAKTKLRVRGLHIQNTEAEFGSQGQRCAINLTGNKLRKSQIKRGDWVASAQVTRPVTRFDAEIRIINNSPQTLVHWTPVHLHHAASESTARVALLEKQPIQPGEQGLVQVVSDHAIGAVFDDYFIIRDQSARATLGGGRVIDIFPPKRGRSSAERIEWLKQLRQDDAKDALQSLIISSLAGVNLNQFAMNRNLTEQALTSISDQVAMVVLNNGEQKTGFSIAIMQRHCDSVLQALKSCQCASPDKNEFSESDLLKQAKFQFPPSFLKVFLKQLLNQSAIENNRGGYSIAANQNPLSDIDNTHWRAIRKAMKVAACRGMTIAEISKETELSAKQLNHFLIQRCRDGLLVKLSTNLYILPSCLMQLRDLVEQNHDEVFSVAEFKKASDIGRNRCIVLLECFDAKGITKRTGEGRVLLPKAAHAFDRLLKKNR